MSTEEARQTNHVGRVLADAPLEVVEEVREGFWRGLDGIRMVATW